MSCGMGLIKYLLFIFNFVFAVCGLGMLAVGVIMHLQLTHFADTFDDNIKLPSITLIVIGSVIFVISFFGCCGAIRENHCMTITFASFLLFILIVQVAIAVYTFVVIRDTDLIKDKNYRQFFESYPTNKENRELVDFIQSSLKCCGVNSKEDFMTHGNFNGTIPWSCCGKEEGQFCSKSDSYDTGCVESLKNAILTMGTTLGGVALGIAGVELIGIIFALCLANSIKNSERRSFRV